jgi:hypothetical protein
VDNKSKQVPQIGYSEVVQGTQELGAKPAKAALLLTEYIYAYVLRLTLTADFYLDLRASRVFFVDN